MGFHKQSVEVLAWDLGSGLLGFEHTGFRVEGCWFRII